MFCYRKDVYYYKSNIKLTGIINIIKLEYIYFYNYYFRSNITRNYF